MQLVRAIIFSMSLMLFQVGISQNLTNYSGPYKGGIASYKYYEDKDLNRVLNGPFKFTYSSNLFNPLRKLQSISIGNFKDNLKVGIWKYYLIFDDVSLCTSGNYINNLKDGEWIFEEVQKATKKVLRKSIVHFKNDILIGPFIFNCSSQYSYFPHTIYNPLIKGTFDNRGKLDSIWITKVKSKNGILYEDRKEYSNGSLVNETFRDPSDGTMVKFKGDLAMFENDMREHGWEPYVNLNSEAISFWRTWNEDDFLTAYALNPMFYFNRFTDFKLTP